VPELRTHEAVEAVVAEEPPTVREHVRRWLLSELLHGRVPLPTKDDPLSENWLAKAAELDSRMPARMALAVLAGEGLILQRARRGFWMVEYDSDDMVQVLAMRADVEARVVAALCGEAGPDDVEAWHDVVRANRDMQEMVHEGGAPADFADLEARFHVGLALTADLRVAARYIDEWSNQMRLFQLQNRIETPPSQEAVDRHRKLIVAIVKSNRDAAVDLVRRDVASLGAPVEEPEPEERAAMQVRGFEVATGNVEEFSGGYAVAEN
jgi:DNA-binding GntR family transcriptional regulator